jgi:molecular chaperone GrpE
VSEPFEAGWSAARPDPGAPGSDPGLTTGRSDPDPATERSDPDPGAPGSDPGPATGRSDPDPATGRSDPDSAAATAADRAAAAGPAGSSLDDVEADLDAVMAEVQAGTLEALVAERDDYLDSLRRLQADFENYKKRVVRQQAEQMERAAERLVDKMLPVLDTADLALSHGAGDDVAQLRVALLGALEREGLERIDPAGEEFDPNVADAVAHEPGDGGGMTVAEVLRAGYRWKGRVLRPAMVKVRG